MQRRRQPALQNGTHFFGSAPCDDDAAALWASLFPPLDAAAGVFGSAGPSRTAAVAAAQRGCRRTAAPCLSRCIYLLEPAVPAATRRGSPHSRAPAAFRRCPGLFERAQTRSLPTAGSVCGLHAAFERARGPAASPCTSAAKRSEGQLLAGLWGRPATAHQCNNLKHKKKRLIIIDLGAIQRKSPLHQRP